MFGPSLKQWEAQCKSTVTSNLILLTSIIGGSPRSVSYKFGRGNVTSAKSSGRYSFLLAKRVAYYSDFKSFFLMFLEERLVRFTGFLNYLKTLPFPPCCYSWQRNTGNLELFLCQPLLFMNIVQISAQISSVRTRCRL